MSKKNKKKVGDEKEPALPKFGGFNALAAGLGDLKAKIDRETKEKVEAKRKQDEARIAAGKKPLPAPKPVQVQAPPPPPKRGGGADESDEMTFHRMMSGVTPLENRASRVTTAGEARIAPARITAAEIQAKAKEEAKSVLDHLHHLVDDAVRFEVSDDGKRVEGRRVDVPPNLLRELRRGVFPIDGRLDLHGLGVEAAREQLLEFLRTMRTRGEKCVLIIHGKGERSPNGQGVLRGEISAWLSQGRAREHVAAFSTACEEDGGEGAVYVALRK